MNKSTFVEPQCKSCKCTKGENEGSTKASFPIIISQKNQLNISFDILNNMCNGYSEIVYTYQEETLCRKKP